MPAPRGARALVWLGSRLGPLATLRKSVETLSGLSWTWLRDTIFALITTKDGRVTPLNGRYFTQIIATSFKDMRTTGDWAALLPRRRSEEHTSELQSLMRISFAVFCLKK